jgi:hypothetical protein
MKVPLPHVGGNVMDGRLQHFRFGVADQLTGEGPDSAIRTA